MSPKWIAMGVGVTLVAAFGISTWAKRTPPLESIPTLASEGTRPPPDLSSMSPEEQAIRLYDRIMSATTQGLSDEALFFRPMALQAYGNLTPFTNKFRFHVAMIHAATGDLASAQAHADTLGRSAPNYLLGFVVRHRIAELNGDHAAANEAVERFQQAFGSESATNNPDYIVHAPLLQQFRSLNPPR